MKRLIHGLLRRSTYLPLLIAVAVYIVVALLSPKAAMFMLTNGIDIAVWILIVTLYVPILWESLRKDKERKDQFWVTGVLIMWMAIAASAIWRVVYVFKDRPEWMQDHWFTSFCYFMIAVSGFYFIKMPASSKPSSGWRYVMWAFVLAVLICTAIAIAIYR